MVKLRAVIPKSRLNDAGDRDGVLYRERLELVEYLLNPGRRRVGPKGAILGAKLLSGVGLHEADVTIKARASELPKPHAVGPKIRSNAADLSHWSCFS